MACAPNKLGVFSAHFRRFDMISNRLVQPKPPVLVHFQTVATKRVFSVLQSSLYAQAPQIARLS